MLMRRSRNSYIRAPRRFAFAPMGTPSRSLKFAIDFFARGTIGFCPVIACRSAVAKSRTLAFSRPSPTPMLMTIFSSRGTWNGFVYPRAFMIAGSRVLWNDSFNRAGISLAPFGRPFAGAPVCGPAPAFLGWPLPADLAAWGFWAGFGVSFAMVFPVLVGLALVDRLPAPLSHPGRPAVGEDPGARPPP